MNGLRDCERRALHSSIEREELLRIIRQHLRLHKHSQQTYLHTHPPLLILFGTVDVYSALNIRPNTEQTSFDDTSATAITLAPLQCRLM